MKTSLALGLLLSTALFPSPVVLAATSSTTSSTTTAKQHTAARSLQQDDECANGEELVVLNILLDSTPEQTGYSLVCDMSDLWEKTADTAEPDSWLTDTVCVPESAQCTFSISDSASDGLLDGGWYSLTFGATTVAVYDYTPFTENTYCFGQGCTTADPALAPLEVLEEEEEECDTVFFGIKFDEAPQDVGILLSCDGVPIWTHLSFGPSMASESITLEECVSPSACCTFSVLDSANNGLAAPGNFELEVAYDSLMNYEGSMGLQYGLLSVAFGDCS
jgi:hypothetical protein